MKVKRPNNESGKDMIIQYAHRSIQELQLIRPNWACGDNIHHLFSSSLILFKGEYTIFYTNTADLIANSEFFEVKIERLFTGDNESLNDGRIARLLFHWENGGYVDPPGIYLGDENKILFFDGRHRTKLAYQLGVREIPVAVNNSHIKLI